MYLILRIIFRPQDTGGDTDLAIGSNPLQAVYCCIETSKVTAQERQTLVQQNSPTAMNNHFSHVENCALSRSLHQGQYSAKDHVLVRKWTNILKEIRTCFPALITELSMITEL